METVKSALASALLQAFGPGCVLELDTKEQCIKLELPVSRDHVIYVQPDAYERHFLCHYAHKTDLQELLCDPNGDSLAWKQRNAAQLPLRVKGAMPRDFASVAAWYAGQAAERIERMKELGGRRASFPRLETFDEARARVFNDPEPGKTTIVAAVAQEGRKAPAVLKRLSRPL